MTTLAAELDGTSNQMLLCPYGDQFALGFKGTKDFIERGFNLAFNYGMTNGQLRMLYDSCGYVFTDLERIKRGFASYFYGELRRTGEVKPLVEGTYENGYESVYDEAALESLSARKADSFMAEHVDHVSFMLATDNRLAHRVAQPQDDGAGEE